MPVCGIPKCLEVMMTTLFESQNLQGWSIFQEKNSSTVTLKIRFTEPTCNSSESVPACSYKKKSTAQADRDRKRAANFISKTNGDGMITRSKSKEKPRTVDMDYLPYSQSLSQVNGHEGHTSIPSDPDISVATCDSSRLGDLSKDNTPDNYSHDLHISHTSPEIDINTSHSSKHEPQTINMDYSPIPIIPAQMSIPPLLPLPEDCDSTDSEGMVNSSLEHSDSESDTVEGAQSASVDRDTNDENCDDNVKKAMNEALTRMCDKLDKTISVIREIRGENSNINDT